MILDRFEAFKRLREQLSGMDRRTAIAGAVVGASALLLAVGLVSIFLALSDDNVDLPNEGSLEDILGQQAIPYPVGERPPSGPPPVHIRIPEIGVDANVVQMGLGADRFPEVPDSGSDVAWYTFSAPPGAGSNAVFSGHVDWIYRDLAQQGVFYRLRELDIGDAISVDLDDGSTKQYRVTGNVAVDYNDPNVLEVMGPTEVDVLTLITCGGSWVRDASAFGGNYSHRVIVRAEKVSGLASAPADGG
jgi:LPXTG-site transpeptidase (sortase) family protein